MQKMLARIIYQVNWLGREYLRGCGPPPLQSPTMLCRALLELGTDARVESQGPGNDHLEIGLGGGHEAACGCDGVGGRAHGRLWRDPYSADREERSGAQSGPGLRQRVR